MERSYRQRYYKLEHSEEKPFRFEMFFVWTIWRSTRKELKKIEEAQGKNCTKCFRIFPRPVIWGTTMSAKLGKSLANAFVVTYISKRAATSALMWSSTVVINVLNVVSVSSCHLRQAIWMSTCLFTQERNLLFKVFQMSSVWILSFNMSHKKNHEIKTSS